MTKSCLIVNITAWGSCTLTYFDRHFLFFCGSVKSDVHIPVLQKICKHLDHEPQYFHMIEFTVKCPVIFVHKQRMELCQVVTNVLRKPVLSG